MQDREYVERFKIDKNCTSVCRKAIQEVFRGDMRGEISFEAVKLINHLVKSRKHNVRTDVVDVLLSLRSVTALIDLCCFLISCF